MTWLHLPVRFYTIARSHRQKCMQRLPAPRYPWHDSKLVFCCVIRFRIESTDIDSDMMQGQSAYKIPTDTIMI